MTASIHLVSPHDKPVEQDVDPVAEALKLAVISLEFVARAEIAKMRIPCSAEEAEYLINHNTVLNRIKAGRDVYALRKAMEQP